MRAWYAHHDNDSPGRIKAYLALENRRRGMTYKQVGIAMDLSYERARQLATFGLIWESVPNWRPHMAHDHPDERAASRIRAMRSAALATNSRQMWRDPVAARLYVEHEIDELHEKERLLRLNRLRRQRYHLPERITAGGLVAAQIGIALRINAMESLL